jgi:hypothetical protein
MLHVEDAFKLTDILICYYIYLACSACKLVHMHLCMCCLVIKLNINKNCKWMFSLHFTYLPIGPNAYQVGFLILILSLKTAQKLAN